MSTTLQNRINDDQVTEVAKSLGWKVTDPDKIRNLLSLNGKSAKVQAAIQAEIEKPELEDPNTEGPCEFDEDDQDEAAPTREEEAKAGVSFGMDEKGAANYIQAQFGLVKRMAKRAVDRGIIRDEYHGKGYCVKVTDLNPGVTDDFDIRVYAE